MIHLAVGECRVLIRLADQSEFKEIASDFGVSVNTVTTQAKRAYRKLGVNNRYDAVERHKHLRGHTCFDHRRPFEPEVQI